MAARRPGGAALRIVVDDETGALESATIFGQFSDGGRLTSPRACRVERRAPGQGRRVASTDASRCRSAGRGLEPAAAARAVRAAQPCCRRDRWQAPIRALGHRSAGVSRCRGDAGRGELAEALQQAAFVGQVRHGPVRARSAIPNSRVNVSARLRIEPLRPKRVPRLPRIKLARPKTTRGGAQRSRQ